MSFFLEDSKAPKLPDILDKVPKVLPGEVRMYGDITYITPYVRPIVNKTEWESVLSGQIPPDLLHLAIELIKDISNRSHTLIKDETIPSGYKCLFSEQTIETSVQRYILSAMTDVLFPNRKLRSFLTGDITVGIRSRLMNIMINLLQYCECCGWRWIRKEGTEDIFKEATKLIENICTMEGYRDQKSNKRRRKKV